MESGVQLTIPKESGLKIQRYWTKAGENPFEKIEWDMRSSVIKNPDGSVVFEMHNIEVPKFWSQVATDILAQKYFRKTGIPQFDASGKPLLDAFGKQILGSEASAKQTIHRLAGCWRYWGEKYGYFASPADAQAFYDEMVFMLINQYASPNSPQWFNTGLHWAYGINGPAQGHYYIDPDTKQITKSADSYSHPQVHACFILSIKDDLVNEGGIMDFAVREARIFKYGSGSGANFSSLRGKGERLSGGGKSSGLMSFLKIFDTVAGSIKSGGTTRRAAKMVVLDADHPEIEDFVEWKAREEKKVAALIAAGYPSDYEGEAYQTVSGQNSNNSVRIPNKFMHSIEGDGDWSLTWRTDGRVCKTLKARELWNRIAKAAWACADPGVQYDDIVNDWHTCLSSGRIRATNPCVTGDTKVLVDGGRWVRIDKLVGEQTTILTNTGTIHPSVISGSFETGMKPVYRLTTKSGYDLKLTVDHKVFTANRGFVPAAELTKDDFVLLPAHQAAPIEEPEDKTFYQILGVYLGDGCGSGTRNVIQLTMHPVEERPVLEKFATYTAGFERKTHQNSPGTVMLTSTTSKLTIANQKLMAQLSQFVDISLESYEKVISDAIFELPLGAQKYVLQGLFTADATVANYGEKSQYVSLDSTSLEMLKGVQVLLLGFGIKSKLYKNRRAGKTVSLLPDSKGGMKEYNVKEVHSLRISRSGRILFEKLIGFMPESKKAAQLADVNTNVDAYADSPFDSVSSLEFLGEETVYDLTEPITHTFVANGITIHNCSEYNFLNDTACNLASLNLMKFFDSDRQIFDVEGYKHAVRLWTIVLEISVLMAQYPSKEIAMGSYNFRTLGLGYANLGTMLMVSGIPYDSPEGRAICAAVTAIMTGESYAASAEMAAILGTFPEYEKNREHMLRVVRNHRRVVYNARPEEYDNVSIVPPGIDPKFCPSYMLTAAIESWDRALEMGERYGYRNAQTTLIAPTGTIALQMDCDTTGIEPDFALVKFKKLAGGGYFKIVNKSVETAMKNLGYTQDQVRDIIKYLVGANTLRGSPFINDISLKKKGLKDEDIMKIEKQLPVCFELSNAFNVFALGKECLERLGVPADKYNSANFNMLKVLGFSDQEIDAANEYICGAMTIEGAPHLKLEHYAVFDCANKCGKKGSRFLSPMSHVRMMSAAQPLLSGSISKTVNMPNEVSAEDVKEIYFRAWKLGLKCIAIYRDGCKLSQPLSSKAAEAVAEKKPLRRKLPDERQAITHKFNIGGHEGYLTVGLFEDGQPGEIFTKMNKEGSTISGLMDAFAIAVSMALQHGVPLKTLASKFVHTKFDPSGPTSNPQIRMAKSLMDYLFRWLGMKFMTREDQELCGILNTESNGHSNGVAKAEQVPKAESFAPLTKFAKDEESHIVGEHSVDIQSDAPPCYVCGSMMIRSGACYLCVNCGANTGCSG